MTLNGTDTVGIPVAMPSTWCVPTVEDGTWSVAVPPPVLFVVTVASTAPEVVSQRSVTDWLALYPLRVAVTDAPGLPLVGDSLMLALTASAAVAVVPPVPTANTV